MNVEVPENYRPAYDKAMIEFRASDPTSIAVKADVPYVNDADGGGHFTLRYFGRSYTVSFPEGTVTEANSGKEVSFFTQILLLHYLTLAGGASLTGNWVSFRQLPGGLVYEAAFRARSLQPLIATFGRDGNLFLMAGKCVGGEIARLGDHSFLFRVLPRLSLMCVLWLSDEEMPAEVSILFDASAGEYLPTEDLAAVAGTLSGKLVRAVAP